VTSRPPRFAIVGHPNKGKSSIVATLAEDDSVRISPLPGTTVDARSFPMRVDGSVLYELIDTPGFQRARETLAWLRAHALGAEARPAVLAEFVSAHRDDARFRDECELRRRSWRCDSTWSTARTRMAGSTRPKWKCCAGPAGPAWH
jgi:GTPase Era involved in 16S rRNA processing